MTKKQRAKIVQKILNEYFPNPKIPLKHTNLYTFLIAILLSAQSTDAKVNEITPSLFKKAPNPKKMLNLSLKELEKIIKPIGLAPQKAKAILSLSKTLVEKYHSRVPNTFEELETLRGVGHKTASVIMSQGFKKPAFAVDTHIHRCAKRWKLSNGKNVKKTEVDLKKLFDKKSWSKLHIQIIYYAREYCPAKGHKISNCPICLKIAAK
ncbi:MAG: Endonuclease III [Candidatus Anoxychlamydiales bacterium]|nr:Endonuclease III [Candidatus Anoxychlamydiales bacterium]NGX35631.1 Endonuclease III [Candidatus Anoxychlamydiales bacterium]